MASLKVLWYHFSSTNAVRRPAHDGRGERAEDERRGADTCVAATLAVRVLDL